MSTKGIAIFVSGRGSNAAAILEKESAFRFTVNLIVVSNKNAPAITLAQRYNIPYFILNKSTFPHSTEILDLLQKHQVAVICLAGFLWKIPDYLIQAYPNNIINIHPSLLPKYGGKGMYGMKVHEAVIANQEKYSGLTIHLVNEEYDKGKVLFQTKIAIEDDEKPDALARRILSLEHQYFAQVINAHCQG